MLKDILIFSVICCYLFLFMKINKDKSRGHSFLFLLFFLLHLKVYTHDEPTILLLSLNKSLSDV